MQWSVLVVQWQDSWFIISPNKKKNTIWLNRTFSYSIADIRILACPCWKLQLELIWCQIVKITSIMPCNQPIVWFYWRRKYQTWILYQQPQYQKVWNMLGMSYWVQTIKWRRDHLYLSKKPKQKRSKVLSQEQFTSSLVRG